mmetsp:Transcript_89279/g.254853  ORF Transcript_89279/g.254853 Transcript_89279/m.254853 type:complete len:236 (+) Transcript_89279:473-1180(+)
MLKMTKSWYRSARSAVLTGITSAVPRCKPHISRSSMPNARIRSIEMANHHRATKPPQHSLITLPHSSPPGMKPVTSHESSTRQSNDVYTRRQRAYFRLYQMKCRVKSTTHSLAPAMDHAYSLHPFRLVALPHRSDETPAAAIRRKLPMKKMMLITSRVSHWFRNFRIADHCRYMGRKRDTKSRTAILVCSAESPTLSSARNERPRPASRTTKTRSRTRSEADAARCSWESASVLT